MFDAIISFSLKNRFLILVLTLLVAGVGGYFLGQAPVDVFPDLNRPTVAIMTEFPGRTPEDVERYVTYPIESVMNGAPGVQRVRSASAIGLSIVWVEFAWGTDVLTDQQIVSQQLRSVHFQVPVEPRIQPPASIMGEVTLIGLDAADGKTSPMELRTLADWTIRPRLMGLGGIAQVTVIGGQVKQYQVLTDPDRLGLHGVTLRQLSEAVEGAFPQQGGGLIQQGGRELPVSVTTQSVLLEKLKDVVVRTERPGGPLVRVRQVADVLFSGPVPRGDAAVRLKTENGQVRGGPAIILAVSKQPGANTLELDEKIRSTVAQLQAEFQHQEFRRTHPDVRIHPDVFRQANFIRSAIENVVDAVREGVLVLAVILFLFLWNLRTGVITLIVLPLPLLILGLLFHYFGISLNTMTLGGIAIAIGDLVDDSIVDIENIYRRLKENRQTANPRPALLVVFDASREVRNSIVYATLIVCVVVLPLFFLSGLEGRMFTPMGIAYIATLLASLLVSLTITPVLAYYMLPPRFLRHEGDPVVVRSLKAAMRPVVRFTLRHPYKILTAALVLVALALSALPFMGGELLPRFNEGTLTINLRLPPGSSLAETNRIATQVEDMILEMPEVVAVAHRTGRAELDEHAENVNSTDIEVTLVPPKRLKDGGFYSALQYVPFASVFAYEPQGRPLAEIIHEVEERLSELPGSISSNVGQPISHRLDHVLSGVRAQVAVKVFGPRLETLRAVAAEVDQAIRTGGPGGQPIRGVTGLQVEQLEEVEQVRIEPRNEDAALYGRQPAEVAQLMETALRGKAVAKAVDQEGTFDVVVWYTADARNDLEKIRATLVDTPRGLVPLQQMADVLAASGPVGINRENVRRRIVVSCNVIDRDLAGAVADIRRAVAERVKLPDGYQIEYGGQFEAKQQADTRLALLFPLALVGVFLLLWKALESWRAALQVLVNIPLAFSGAVVALLIVNPPDWDKLSHAAWYEWPAVWVTASSLSLAHWVGFITLTGIVARNGIMMISHYVHLMRHEGEKFDEHMIVRGTLERLTPVLMTAVTSIVGLIPLLLGAGETGKEILYPLAVVVIGGMISSTLLDQLVTPALFYKFGRKVYQSEAAPS